MIVQQSPIPFNILQNVRKNDSISNETNEKWRKRASKYKYIIVHRIDSAHNDELFDPLISIELHKVTGIQSISLLSSSQFYCPMMKHHKRVFFPHYENNL